jgi:putative addiction module component (TIGR02574 family)
MANSRDDIFHGALALDTSERAELIELLIGSLDSQVDGGVEQAWRNEIERRARELDLGTVQSVPWEFARDRLARASRG